MSESITHDVERVLRALDERCAARIDELNDKSDRLHISGNRDGGMRLASNADGLNLARSYIADALRGVL